MIKGTYIFYENGKELYRQDNVITKFGKRFLTNYLAGNATSSSRDMAIGVHRHEVLVTAASASAGTITYTANNNYSAGDVISVYGLSTTTFNLSNVTINSATSSQFTIVNAATGISVSGSSTGRAYKPATENDTRLGFEFYRVPINLASPDIQTATISSSYAVVYKATIPQDVSGTISEIGLYPSTRMSIVNYDSKFLSDFYDAMDWNTTSGFNPASSTNGARIGSTILNFESGSGTAREYILNTNLDLTGYNNQDTMNLAYYKNDNNVSNIRIKLYHADDSWFYHDIVPPSGLGYKISPDLYMSDLFNQHEGTTVAERSSIVKIGIEVTPTSGQTTTVGMDGLRINDEDTFDPIYGLISRTTLATPLEKAMGRQVDVEYRLDLGF